MNKKRKNRLNKREIYENSINKRSGGVDVDKREELLKE